MRVSIGVFVGNFWEVEIDFLGEGKKRQKKGRKICRFQMPSLITYATAQKKIDFGHDDVERFIACVPGG